MVCLYFPFLIYDAHHTFVGVNECEFILQFCIFYSEFTVECALCEFTVTCAL